MAHSFKDTKERVWIVDVNYTAVKRVKALTDVNLADAATENSDIVGNLSSDPMLLCDVLYAICKPQCDAQNITDEQFGESLAGDAIDVATEAMLTSLVNFFRGHQRRPLLVALAKIAKLETMVEENAIEKLNDGTIEAELKKAMSTNLSGSSPASSASTPAP